ncbi:cytochrome P450 [Saccharopolyspora sp. ASAGF58]|uniref:cytochrome P450 family protein n=1 Tax=Saccharopolyspora sp. ASAGF58 TaxID=2719023 RepID=UPI0014401844|nr:cytochrome P450 [Saccharopolyspora sp. ASAGF58]QIZ36154.1 cytochrome P450 [Saccharopolyspora sp. ASAGF58]
MIEINSAFVTEPRATYARLRSQGPVHRATAPDGTSIWLVTRYADVRAALADPRLSLDKKNSGGGYRGFSLPPALDANLLNMDAPEHARLRRIIGKAFAPRRIEPLRPRVQQIADELLDALTGQDEADLLPTYCAPLPITVICELLGVDAADRPDFRSWTDGMLAPETLGQARDALRALYRYLLDLIAAKRANPGADFLSTLIELRDEEDRLSEDELTSAAFLMLFAGYENTVNLLGNGLAALLTRPSALARARRGISPTTVDELLRFDPPPQLAIRRFPVADVEIGGVTIPAGETVLLSLVSAHHDPDRYAEPDHLDLGREDNPHLAFGHGPHYCLGASLARMEGEIGFGALLSRFPNLTLTVSEEELQWRNSFRNRGLRTLPVALG